MSDLLQNTIVFTLLAAAAGYVTYRSLKAFRNSKSGGCDSGCGTCSGNQAAAGGVKIKTLVPLEVPQEKERTAARDGSAVLRNP